MPDIEKEVVKVIQISEETRRKRVKSLREKTGLSLATLSLAGLDASSTGGNVENYIGTIQIPMGLAGPLEFQFKEGAERIHAPIATTEGALVSSITRGAHVLTLSGGVKSRVISNRMIRAPQFEVESIDQALCFRAWIKENFELLKGLVHRKSSHAELLEIDVKILGKTVHTRFIYSTGDAAGQNMTTFCTALVCDWIIKSLAGSKEIQISDYLIEGNLSSDKKVSVLTAIEGRGRSVIAEAVIKGSVLRRVLKLTPEQMVNRFSRSKSARIFTGQIGYNINIANVVAGLFLSTGQDAACIHECSVGEFHIEAQGEDLYVSLYMPSLIVGTVGGGVKFPGPQDNLSLLGCIGKGKADRLAEIICGYCLALEISTVSAIGAGNFVEAHDRLGRKALPAWLEATDVNEKFFEENLHREDGQIVRKVIAMKTFENRHGHVSDMAFQVSKKFCGLLAYQLEIENSNTQVLEKRNIFLKIKPKDSEIVQGASRILEMLSPPIAQMFLAQQKYLPFYRSHEREVEVSEYLHRRHPRLTPGLLGTFKDENKEAFVLIQKLIDSTYIKSPVMEMQYWTAPVIQSVLDQIAAVHAEHWQGEALLAAEMPTLLKPLLTSERQESLNLWNALLELSAALMQGPVIDQVFEYGRHSLDRFIVDGDLIKTMPLTLIHNDFNSRNLALNILTPERSPLVFDWEFAAVGLAQRDLIEFLIFTLPADVTTGEIHLWLESYCLNMRSKTGMGIDTELWNVGCQIALREFVITRLPFYMIISQFNRCDYLERILHTTARFVEAVQGLKT